MSTDRAICHDCGVREGKLHKSGCDRGEDIAASIRARGAT